MAARLELLKEQFFDDDGEVLVGGKLNTYIVGTSTAKATYTTVLGDVAQANPVVLDSDGRIPSDLYGVGAYKIVITDSDDVMIDTIPSVSGVNSASMTTIGDYSGDFDAAITAIDTTETTLYVDEAATMSTAVTVPATCTVVIQKGGSIDQAGNALVFNGLLIMEGGTIDNDAALTINGPFTCGVYAAFDSTSYGTFGVGAVQRIFPEWWGENTTPGTTDMTTEIQAAIDSLTVGEVFFQGETYLISSPLVPETNVNLVGTSGSIIKLADSTDDDMVDFTGTDTDIVIEGIKFDGNGSNNTRGDGVNIIHVTTKVKRFTIKNCIFTNSCYNSIRFDASLSHEDIIITENKFYDYDATAVQVYGAAGGVISDNIFDNTGLASLTAGANGIQLVTGTDITISNNTIDMDSTASSACFGIELFTNSDNCTISGNSIQCNSGAKNGGISIDASTNVSISGNSIYQSGWIGAIEASGTEDGCSITGNTIDGTANGTASIAINNDNANVVISGNTISNYSGYGINIDLSSGTYTNCYSVSIIGNTFTDSTAGVASGLHSIRCNGAPGRSCVISGNSIHTNTNCYGINLITTSDESRYMIGFVITNNIIYGTAKAMSLAGTDHANHVITGNTLVSNTAESTFAGTECVIKNNTPDTEELTSTITLNRYIGSAYIDSSGGAVAATLGDGYFIGQIKVIVMTDDTTSSTVSITNHQTFDPEVATFDAVDETGVFMWTGTEWITIFATCTFL